MVDWLLFPGLSVSIGQKNYPQVKILIGTESESPDTRGYSSSPQPSCPHRLVDSKSFHPQKPQAQRSQVSGPGTLGVSGTYIQMPTRSENTLPSSNMAFPKTPILRAPQAARVSVPNILLQRAYPSPAWSGLVIKPKSSPVRLSHPSGLWQDGCTPPKRLVRLLASSPYALPIQAQGA